MANERPNAYDFFMIVCGPIPLSERSSCPRRRAGDRNRRPGRRECGWKVIETSRSVPPGAVELGEMEPTARRSG